MLIAWVVGVQVLAAAGDVGSVDGPQAFVEALTVADGWLQERQSVNQAPLPNPSGVAVAAQARVVTGWGVRLGAHRLLFGLDWKPSLLLLDKASSHAPLATPGVLEPSASAVFVTPHGVLRAHVSVPLSWSSGVRFVAHFRRHLSERLLFGVEADVSARVGPLLSIWSSTYDLQCSFPDPRCTTFTLARWSTELSALVEWRFRDDWSLAGRLSVAERSESNVVFTDVLLSSPDWRASEASLDTIVTWCATSFFGLSASVAVNGTVRTDDIIEKSVSMGLSVWLRTDARLQRNWIDL